MDDLYLARMGNAQFQCQPEMVGPLHQAGYSIYRYVEKELTAQEIAAIVRHQEELYAND